MGTNNNEKGANIKEQGYKRYCTRVQIIRNKATNIKELCFKYEHTSYEYQMMYRNIILGCIM